MALEKILDEVKKLPKAAREKLMQELRKANLKDKDSENFEKAAGSWADLDAEEFIAEVYLRRNRSERVSDW